MATTKNSLTNFILSIDDAMNQCVFYYKESKHGEYYKQLHAILNNCRHYACINDLNGYIDLNPDHDDRNMVYLGNKINIDKSIDVKLWVASEANKLKLKCIKEKGYGVSPDIYNNPNDELTYKKMHNIKEYLNNHINGEQFTNYF